eukprot:11222868-Lingulodinium_polyedra.AAC.1
MHANLDNALNRAACEPRGFQWLAIGNRFNKAAYEAATRGCFATARAAQTNRMAPFKYVDTHGG